MLFVPSTVLYLYSVVNVIIYAVFIVSLGINLAYKMVVYYDMIYYDMRVFAMLSDLKFCVRFSQMQCCQPPFPQNVVGHLTAAVGCAVVHTILLYAGWQGSRL